MNLCIAKITQQFDVIIPRVTVNYVIAYDVTNYQRAS